MKKILLFFLFIFINSFCFSQIISFDSLQIINTGISTSIRSLSIVNDSIIWAGGSHGKIGRSADGGRHWQWFVPGADSLDFRAIHAFSADEIIVANAGFPAHIFRSVNGGISWQQVYFGTDARIFLDAVKFINKRSGMIIGDPLGDSLFILKTNDRGKTWKRSYNPSWPKMKNGEAFFAASNSNIAAQKKYVWLASGGLASRIFFSKDNGRHWRVYDCNIVQGKNSAGIFSIDFVDKENGVVAGGDYLADTVRIQNMLITKDGGKSWQKPIINPLGYRSCIIYITRQTLICTGTSGIDISTNGGITWKNSSRLGFNIVSKSPDGNFIFFAGNNGRMAKMKIK